jgi:hypothetical protein
LEIKLQVCSTTISQFTHYKLPTNSKLKKAVEDLTEVKRSLLICSRPAAADNADILSNFLNFLKICLHAVFSKWYTFFLLF